MKKIVKILVISLFILFLIYFLFNRKNISFSMFRINSGSMMPEICVGEIIAIIEKENYELNDIITYQVNNSYFITHRIVELDGNSYITKGDANNTEDREKVNKEQIKGKVIFHSKILGKVYKYRFLIAVILIIFLILL